PDLLDLAAQVLTACRERKLKLATAESCTGGLISAYLTEISGSSDVFDRGFVTYSNDAKIEMLEVPAETIAMWGAVSEETARAMAGGALSLSRADITVAVTGIAGPGGGSAAKPVGLVHLACVLRKKSTEPDAAPNIFLKERNFGEIGRGAVREETVKAAFMLLLDVLGDEQVA
ncbi:MAG: CinA family protein, partial [Chitinophagales bacterium]|nr:CinA family protein [Hyphomicrobiales bacterium]